MSIASGLATALRIGGVVLGYLGALVDRPHLLSERQNLSISTKLEPGTPVPVVYGRGKVGGIVADWFIDPSSNKLFLYYIVTFAHGSRDGLGLAATDSIWLDQRKAVDLVPVAIASSSGGPPTATVTTSVAHNFATGDYVTISGHSSAINGALTRVQSTPSPTTFTVLGTGGGTGGNVIERLVHPYDLGRVWYTAHLGSTVQNVGGTTVGGFPSPASVSGSGWSATTATGKGLCVIAFVLINIDVTGLSGELGPLFHGPPTVAAILRGNRIYDPRTDTWTPGGDNPALVIRDYLLSTIYGCGYSPALINETSFTAAADYCDVLESHPVGAPVVITSSSVANPTVVTTATPHGWASGQLVRIANHTGSTPTINGDRTATVTGASTFTVPVNVTVGGTGGTVTKLVQTKRFTCNGVLDTARPVSDNLQELLSSCRGNLVWAQGQFSLTIRSAAPFVASLLTSGMLTQSGLTAFTADLVVDGDTSFGNLAWHTDSAVSGATLQVDLGASVTQAFTECRIYAQLAGYAGLYAVEYSDNGSAWTTVVASFAPTLVRMNRTTWGAAGTHRYWRLRLTNTPGPGSWLAELQFGPAPTLTLSPANILGEWSFRNAGLEEKWNLVKASYVEPANGEFKIQEVQWPVVGTTNAYLATDGDFSNRLDLPLPFTNDQLIAQTIAQVTLNESRLGIGAQVRCTEEALAASVGDLVSVTHPTPGWTAKQFWVTAMQAMPDTTVALSLQEYDATAYDLATSEDRRTFPPTSHPSLFTVPPPGAVTLTALTPAGVLIGWVGAAYGFVDYYEVQARNTGGDPYVTVAHVRETGADLEATAPLARPGQTWQARVRVINTVGWPSAWVESSPFTIPELPGSQGVGVLVWEGFAPTINITVDPPDLVSVSRTTVGSGNLCGDGVSWQHQVGWTTTGAADDQYQIDIDVASDAAGTSFFAWQTGLTTVSSSVTENTFITVPTAGGSSSTTYYRKYRVKMIRKSDGAEIEHLDTGQGTRTSRTGPCPF